MNGNYNHGIGKVVAEKVTIHLATVSVRLTSEDLLTAMRSQAECLTLS